MRKIFIWAFAIAALLPSPAGAQEIIPGVGFGTQSAWEKPMQNMGENQTRPGYQRIQWEPGTVMPVKLRDGMLTVINFPEWETIRDAYVGDKDFFDGRPVDRNTFMISPVDGRAMADTNLFIFGNSGNRYVFYLRSEPLNSERITASIVDVIVPARFSRGGGGAAAGAGGGGFANTRSLMGGQNFVDTRDNWDSEDFGWIQSVHVDPTQFRFDLDVFVPNPDDYVIAPERVWRDQVFTYIDFGEKALFMNQRPVVSMLVEGGESPVGFRTEGPQSRLLVVEAVGDLVLRNGQRIVCIKLRSKPYLLSNPPPPQNLIAVAGSVGGAAPGHSVGAFGGGFVQQPGFAQMPHGMHPGMQQGGMVNALHPAQWHGMPMPVQEAPGQRPAGGPRTNASVLPNHHVPLVRQGDTRVSVEIFQGKSVLELENRWLDLTERLAWLDEYTPFFSVETSGVDEIGQQRYYGGELYRLRIGPFSQIDVANEVCQRLSLQNVPCAVVRTQ